MKTLNQFLEESYTSKNGNIQETAAIVSKLVGKPDSDYQSAKHDVHINGKHVASIYHHPEDDGDGRWEVMKPHSNKEWEENHGDDHHTYDMHRTKKSALAAIASRHLKEETYSDLQEATVSKKNYSWGKMITVHDGKHQSFPLHPDHQKKIAALKNNVSVAFRDETGSIVSAHRVDDKVHLFRKGSNRGAIVNHKHFTEEFEQIDELSIDTKKRYINKAIKDHQTRSAMDMMGSTGKRDPKYAMDNALKKANRERNIRKAYYSIPADRRNDGSLKKEGFDTARVRATESVDVENAGTHNEMRKQKIMHKGKHVATVHTYRGRAGGWISGVYSPEGESANWKYKIDHMDNKRQIVSKIKKYHEGQKQ